MIPKTAMMSVTGMEEIVVVMITITYIMITALFVVALVRSKKTSILSNLGGYNIICILININTDINASIIRTRNNG